jgi:cysteine-rich repeat protein
VCGNGVVEPGEQCDDGNTDNGDGCSSTCQLEQPVSCDDDGSSCDQGCDATTRFHRLNCVLQTPVCSGEGLPPGLAQRISKARQILGQAFQSSGSHGKRLVSRASRMIAKCDRLRGAMERRGTLSSACASDLDDMLSKAKSECQSWRGSL